MRLTGYEAIYLLRMDHDCGFYDHWMCLSGHRPGTWRPVPPVESKSTFPILGWSEEEREQHLQAGIGLGRRICINPYVSFYYSPKSIEKIAKTYEALHPFDPEFNKRDWRADKELTRAMKYWVWLKSTYKRERKPDGAFIKYCRLRIGTRESSKEMMEGIRDLLSMAGLYNQNK
jgi:hypothetical protein